MADTKKFKFTALCISVFFSLAVMANSAAIPLKAAAKPSLIVRNQSVAATPSVYSPAQIKKAYNIDSALGTGEGKTIAIVVAYGNPNIEGDLAKFDTQFSLPAPNITVHNCGSVGSDAYWALETSLDVEWAHALAPKANLLVVNAATVNCSDLLDAVDYAVKNGADIVSMSWVINESSGFFSEDSHFPAGNTVFIAAAGDDGAEVNFPASSPNVISVGGTRLDLDASGNRESETAWDDTGGGISGYESAPSWQKAYGTGSLTKTIPDISFDADPDTGVAVYCSCGSISAVRTAAKGSAKCCVTNSDDTSEDIGNWYKVGGTSLGTPAWAGIIADMNQNAAFIKNPGTFYQAAGSSKNYNPLGCFYDITSNYTKDHTSYSASKGYDEATGLGSPNCKNFLGMTYSTHVQNIGWQNYVYNGALAGTRGRSLRMEGVKLKLSGAVPSGASIVYKAHVQSIGWQKAVSNGALAGTVGKSKRVEAIKITLSGVPGYQVSYRAYVQNYGWLKWQTVNNGTSINNAGTAGTVGRSLRMEAVEVSVKKVS